jgi:double-stranded uracil-DNA glycosylase
LVSAEPVGLLQEAGSDLKNDQLLMGIYDKKFLPEYGLKFVNLVDRPTINVTELKKGDEQAGVRRALRIIRPTGQKWFASSGRSRHAPYPTIGTG